MTCLLHCLFLGIVFAIRLLAIFVMNLSAVVENVGNFHMNGLSGVK